MDSGTPLGDPLGWVNDTKIRLAGGSGTVVKQRDQHLVDMDTGVSVLPQNNRNGSPGGCRISPHEMAEDPREQQTIHISGNLMRTRGIVLNLREGVQKGRRRLITERIELQQLRNEMEVQEDGLVSALEGLLAQTPTQLPDQFAEVKAMR